MPADTTERGFERRICRLLTSSDCEPVRPADADRVEERPATYGPGWTCGFPDDYDRKFCVDLFQLRIFLQTTQAKTAQSLALETDGPVRRKFLARLAREVEKHGTIHLLRHGLRHGQHEITLFFGTPSPGIRERKSVTTPTGSRLPGNFDTAGRTFRTPSISVSSSMACRSSPSN